MSRGLRSVAGQFLVLQAVIIASILGTVGVVSVSQATNDFRAGRTQRLTAVAESLVSTPIVLDRIRDSGVAMYLAPEVARAIDLSGAGRAEFLAPDGRVLVSTDPVREGRIGYVAHDAADRGRGWSGDATEDGRRTVLAQVPVLTATGTVIAVASVSEEYPSTISILAATGQRTLLYLGIGALLGLGGSWLLSHRIKKQTRGLEIAEIATLADHREALLHSIREGVIAVADDGRITLLNDSAQRLLGLRATQVGKPLDEVDIDPGVRDFLRDGPCEVDTVLTTPDHVLAMNRRRARLQGRSIGSVTTMRDSTELAELQSRLSSHRSVTDTLRAQTHEFANQLHTISGLTQLGEYTAVTEFIGGLARRRAEISEAVTEYIADPAVAALLIAKTSLAAESSVTLEVDPESALPQVDPALATDVITILGNLIDNAVDACEADARVVVYVHARPRGLDIRVTDSGPGVPEHLRAEIFTRGVTSKADQIGGRGVGLALVRIVSGQRGGTAVVSDAPGGGAEFWVHLPTVFDGLPGTDGPNAYSDPR